jgi:hypothetical protein
LAFSENKKETGENLKKPILGHGETFPEVLFAKIGGN